MIFLRDAAVFAELGASTPFIAVFIMIFRDVASVMGEPLSQARECAASRGINLADLAMMCLEHRPSNFWGSIFKLPLFHNDALKPTRSPSCHPSHA